VGLLPGTLTADALRLGARALAVASPRVEVLFDPRTLPAEVAAVESNPGVALTRGHEFGLSCTRSTLEELVRSHPNLAPLLAAQIALERPRPAPCLMGVLNVTPDSFSDGGRYFEPAAAIQHGRHLATAGAAWIDVGGESTRPGATAVSADEETRRVTPVIEALAADGLRLSIDTTKAAVARAALDAGASWVNDISGGRTDPELLPLVAERGCGLVLMHSQGDPATMQVDPRYVDPVAQVAGHLRARALAAVQAGVDPARLVLDPGIGFGKRLEHNLAILRRLPELCSLGFPLLLGVSRKSFIGHLSGAQREDDWRAEQVRDRPSQRLGGSAAALTACVLGGAEILRVHDVEVMAEALAVARALVDPPGGAFIDGEQPGA
jgi:dihydropteroate synthase